MKGLISRNPYTGQVKQQFAYYSNEIIEKCLQRTLQGFRLQVKRQPKDKMGMIKELILQIQRSQHQISTLITFQTGKPIVEAENQVKQALKICEYYSKHAEAILPSNVKSNARKKTLIKYLPLGTVLCMLPFTHPFSLTLYHTLPQLLLGNCVMVKNSSVTPSVGKLIERLMIKSGFESGEYQSMLFQRDRSEYLLSRNEIVGVSFTGSSDSAKTIAALAGKHLKISCVNGSSNDAMIVMEDAELGLAIQNAIKAGFYNSGQAGSSPKRIIIHSNIYEQFKTQIIQKSKQLVYGNPLDRQTSIGPLAKFHQYQSLRAQIKRMPYKIIYQYEDIQKPFFPLTIIEAQRINFDQQILGPVIILFKAKDNQQMMDIANGTKYSKNNYVFSARKAQQIVESLRGGANYVNGLDYGTCNTSKGGIRQSGYGRSGGWQGVRQFANIKTVYIN